ncbi:hypothetical protein GQ457_12G000750 [Hibiscus cannabinus]
MDPVKIVLTESNSWEEQENEAFRSELVDYEGELKKLRNSVELGKWSRALGEKLATSEAELRKVRGSMEVRHNALTVSNSRLVHQIRELGEKLVTYQLVSTNDIDTGKDNKTEQPDVDVMLAEVGKENELLKEKVSSSEANSSFSLLRFFKFLALIKLESSDSEKLSKASDARLRSEGYEKVSESQVLCLR